MIANVFGMTRARVRASDACVFDASFRRRGVDVDDDVAM